MRKRFHKNNDLSFGLMGSERGLKIGDAHALFIFNFQSEPFSFILRLSTMTENGLKVVKINLIFINKKL